MRFVKTAWESFVFLLTLFLHVLLRASCVSLHALIQAPQNVLPLKQKTVLWTLSTLLNPRQMESLQSERQLHRGFSFAFHFDIVVPIHASTPAISLLPRAFMRFLL